MEARLLKALLEASQRQNRERALGNETDNPNELFSLIREGADSITSLYISQQRSKKLDALLADEKIRSQINVKSEMGHTALAMAVCTRQHDIARRILEAVPEADALDLDKPSDSALWNALIGTKYKFGGPTFVFVRWLLAHLKAKGLGDKIAQSLNQALPNVIVRVLVKKQEDPLLLPLLVEYGMDPNLCDSDGWTYLHYAAKRGHVGYVNELIKAGARVDAQITNGSLLTPLHLATINGNIRVVITLLEHGADASLKSGLVDTKYVLSNKTAEDMADIEDEPHLAWVLRGWQSWNPATQTTTTTTANVKVEVKEEGEMQEE